jgi:hypothetical protein
MYLNHYLHYLVQCQSQENCCYTVSFKEQWQENRLCFSLQMQFFIVVFAAVGMEPLIQAMQVLFYWTTGGI